MEDLQIIHTCYLCRNNTELVYTFSMQTLNGLISEREILEFYYQKMAKNTTCKLLVKLMLTRKQSAAFHKETKSNLQMTRSPLTCHQQSNWKIPKSQYTKYSIEV